MYNPNGTENTSDTFIGNINPIRYRSYYYDRETGLYFLVNRYYDPEVGRFINADDVSFIQPETINGLNLYVYCLNNPISYVDHSGCFPVPIWVNIVGFLKDIFAGVGGGLLSAAKTAFAVASKIPMYAGGIKGAWGSAGIGGAGATLNPAYQAALTKGTNLQYAGGILKGIGKVAKVAGYALLAVDVGLSIYNNVTNPNLSTSRKVTDSIVDVGCSVGGFFAASALGAKIGAFAGSFIPIPVVGTIVGAVVGAIVGFGIGLGIYFFQQSSLYTDLKVGFNTFFTQTIPNEWNNIVNGWNDFWSFNWAR